MKGIEYPAEIKTREQKEQVLRWAVVITNETGLVPPHPHPDIIRYYAKDVVAKEMRLQAIANPGQLRFPLADVLTLAGEIEDGEFDQLFFEEFSR